MQSQNMFFQLADIEKQTRIVNELDSERQKLSDRVIDSYSAEPTASNCLNQSLNDALSHGMERSELFSQIESDALNGFIVPSFLDLDLFVGEQQQLPEWARTVFDKEFEKQKGSLDLLAKRIYKHHGMGEARQKHSRQVTSFRLLNDRYRALSERKQAIDIMGEAQKLQSLTKMTSDKFNSYLGAVASKLTAYAQQMMRKCFNFRSDIDKFVTNTTNSWGYQEQTGGLDKNHMDLPVGGWLERAGRTRNIDFYRTGHSVRSGPARNPAWLTPYATHYN